MEKFIVKHFVSIVLIGSLTILLGYSIAANIALKQRIEMISK